MKLLPRIHAERLPLISTAVLCAALYLFACLRYDRFFSLDVTVNLFQDNAALGVAAIGMTFVILSGGIDLSVGAVIGWATIFFAALITNMHVHPLLAMAIVLSLTSLGGAGMGALIHYFKIPPFLITLAALFFFRGVGLLISTSYITIDHPFFFNYHGIADAAITLRHGAPHVPAVYIRPELWALGIVFFAAMFLSLWTPFGRTVYAIGGSEQSALLMGLPVARNRILTYALSGFCAGLAGLMYALNRRGDALLGSGLELDAIAVVVIGGTLLTGGSGSVFGTLLGLLITAIIATVVKFENLNSPWVRISIGGLLLAFILLQKLLQYRRRQT
jgi:simple sugar transport system permease protein